VVQSVGIRATTVYAVSWVIGECGRVIVGILLGGCFRRRTWNSRYRPQGIRRVLLGGVELHRAAIVGGIILAMLENVAGRLRWTLSCARSTGSGIPLFCHDHRADLQTLRLFAWSGSRGLRHGFGIGTFQENYGQDMAIFHSRLPMAVCLPFCLLFACPLFCSDRILTILTMMGISVISVTGSTF